jgi:hypothetical protein
VTRAYAFDEDGKRRANKSIRWTEQFREKQNRRQRRQVSLFDDLRIYNGTNESLPQYGVGKVTSITTYNGEKYATVEKPDTTFSRQYLVNSGSALAYQSTGVAKNRPVVKVLYDTGTPAAGEVWGPKPGQWTASKGYPGFLVLGIVDSTNKIMLARVEEPEIYAAKADGDIAINASGTCSQWVGTPGGSEFDSTVNITNCYNFTGKKIKTNDLVTIYFVDGVAYIGTAVKGSVVARAKVYDASISEAATGLVNLYDTVAVGYAAGTTSVINTARPVFKDETIVVGSDEGSNWLTLGVVSHTLEGTADTTISKDSSGDVTLTALTDTPTITAWSYLGEVASGDTVYVIWFNGKWRIIAAECPVA